MGLFDKANKVIDLKVEPLNERFLINPETRVSRVSLKQNEAFTENLNLRNTKIITDDYGIRVFEKINDKDAIIRQNIVLRETHGKFGEAIEPAPPKFNIIGHPIRISQR
jgi:hypothetical protein